MRVPSACAASGGLIARPVSPLGDGMLCPHDASCTLSADVLCHNPPIPCKGGMDALLRPHTSEPAISREAFPCAVRPAMLSFCEAALPNICEKSCQIFLTIGSKSVTIIKFWCLSHLFGRSSAVLNTRRCFSSYITGSYFHRYLAKPCLLSHLFGETKHFTGLSKTTTEPCGVAPPA